jgi:hypothetical protein
VAKALLDKFKPGARKGVGFSFGIGVNDWTSIAKHGEDRTRGNLIDSAYPQAACLSFRNMFRSTHPTPPYRRARWDLLRECDAKLRPE